MELQESRRDTCLYPGRTCLCGKKSKNSACDSLVSDSRRAVVGIYYSASCESGLFQNFLHDDIVGVCVCPEARHALPAPFYAGLGNTVCNAGGREPVDSPVWPVCQPSALLYHLICRVFSCDEAECSGDFPVCCLADETVPSGDFGFNQFFRRVSFCPLSWIPVRCHELSCMPIYVHQGLEVIMACGSYVKMCLLFHCFGVSCGLCPFFLSAQS